MCVCVGGRGGAGGVGRRGAGGGGVTFKTDRQNSRYFCGYCKNRGWNLLLN